MSKFIRELVIGVVLAVLGIWLSITNQQFLFYGLIVAGVFMIVLAFVHLAQSGTKKGANGASTKRMYPTDKPQEQVFFLQNLDSEENLERPKQISITCSRRDQTSHVSVNGVEVGVAEPDIPLVYAVTKRNNVVSISQQYEGICFFHVTDLDGVGELKIGIGMQSPVLKVIKGTGLEEGILA